MNKTLIDIFKELENLSFKLDEVHKEIKELVPMFDDPEESENPIVKEKLNNRELYIEEYNCLLNKGKNIMNIDSKPIALKCNYFINHFPTTQERLDFINEKLKSEIVLDGTSELFTSLAYSSIVKSYSSFNIVYVAWKFPQIFNENITIIYDDKLESMNTLDS